MKLCFLVFFGLQSTGILFAEEDVRTWTSTEPAVFRQESLRIGSSSVLGLSTNDAVDVITELELHKGEDIARVIWSMQSPGDRLSSWYPVDLVPGQTYTFGVESRPGRFTGTKDPDYSLHELVRIESAGRVLYDRDFCDVHRRKMARKEMDILYGLVLPGSNSPTRVESEALFPHRETRGLGGCVHTPGFSPDTSWESFCPDCTEAFKTWAMEKKGEGYVTDVRNRLFVIECVPRFENWSNPGGSQKAPGGKELVVSDTKTTFRIPWRQDVYPFQLDEKQTYVFVIKGERDSVIEALGLLAEGSGTPEQQAQHNFVSLIRVFHEGRMVYPAQPDDRPD